jgi:cytochrome c553
MKNSRLQTLGAACTLALASLPAVGQQAIAGSAEAARAKVAMCSGCHGIENYKTAFPYVYHVPKIAGQSPAYLVKALQAYKTGERWHPSMQGIAKQLSEQDMADLAAYYAAK